MASVTPASAVLGVPVSFDVSIITGVPSGNVNVGDWVYYSGTGVAAGHSAIVAYWKTSGAGIALESNSAYDRFGNVVHNSAIKIATMGVFHVSASTSGVPTLGLGTFPVSTGSGVAAPTGA